jgi:cytosine/adenosine deaminase-related metal-dependent hydrolase
MMSAMTPDLLLGPDASGRVLRIAKDRLAGVSFEARRASIDLPEGGRHAGGGTAAPHLDSSGAERLDCSGTTLGPGRVNAHTHIYSGLAPFGMPAPDPPPRNFVQILERLWWRLDRALDERSLRASARFYAADALLSGTTTLIDHHESPSFIAGSLDVLSGACEELGIRAILCFGATERNGGRAEARQGLAECRRFVRENRRSNLRGVVGLHASFTVSDETIREAAQLCCELGTVLHVHVAEDRADIEDAKRRGYLGPLERLERLGALPPGSILAHGVHLDAGEVRRARDLGCWIVQNPRSNRGNRVGYPAHLGESELTSLGTDGYPANLLDERDALLEEARRHGESDAVAACRTERGQDIIAQRFEMPFAPLEEGAAADVCAFEGRRARHVIVGGRLLVRNGKLLTADMEAIRGDSREEARRLWERMAALV